MQTVIRITLTAALVFVATTRAGVGAQTRPAVRPADLVLRGGKIVTVDEARPSAEALAITGDTITAVGSAAEIQPYIGPATKVIDLKGALAVPGLIDAHVHFTGVGQAARNLKLATAKNWDDIVRMVGDAAKKAKPGEWILGRGWHQEKWTPGPSPNVEGFPLHDLLSQASPNNPVWLTHASGHAGFANAKAMAVAGVTKATPDPNGGQILKDKSGNPTGLFNERAQSLIGDALARDRAKRTRAQVEADLRTEIQLASEEALSKGLTTVADAGSPPATIELMKKLVDERKLPLRVWMMLRETPDKLAADMPKYRVVNYGDKRFTVRAIKRAVDGALGSRGAWMLEPYSDLQTTSGFNTDSLEDVRRSAELAVINDYQVCVHAIGDRGNREVLDIFEETFTRHSEKDGRQLRWRIEHAQHLSAKDIPRFGQLGVIASMQGIHATSDAVFVLARLGPKRAEEGA
jgi:predicted amidohydrolase YtcJ